MMQWIVMGLVAVSIICVAWDMYTERKARDDNDSKLQVMDLKLTEARERAKRTVRELEQLRDCPEPMVVVLYGDHKPWLSEETGMSFGDEDFYRELKLHFDLDTEEGLLAYISTPYLIWANDAAKELCGCDFSGTAPTISPCYLMNVLFAQLGWDGPAYLQLTNEMMRHLPVIYTNGRYIENGVYTRELSPEGRRLLQEFDCVQYFVHYRPELAEGGPGT
jgi:hypothetical protein